MSETAPIRLVTRDGELIENAAETIQRLEDQVSGLQRDLNAWRLRYANLQRDKDQEARLHALWEPIQELFAYWAEKTGHKRARFTSDRFWEAQPLVRSHGVEACRLAIDGVAYDAYQVTRKNGTTKRFDGWDFVFGKGAARLEELACRAPVDRLREHAMRRQAPGKQGSLEV